MQLLKTFIQKYWALLIMILIGIIAILGVINPPWYQAYQSILWAAAVILTIVFWMMRKKDEE